MSSISIMAYADINGKASKSNLNSEKERFNQEPSFISVFLMLVKKVFML